MVEQGKVITAAGVSSGIDMGLALAAKIAGDEFAKTIQLLIEYDPQPPFDSGSTAKAAPEIVERIRELAAGRVGPGLVGARQLVAARVDRGQRRGAVAAPPAYPPGCPRRPRRHRPRQAGASDVDSLGSPACSSPSASPSASSSAASSFDSASGCSEIGRSGSPGTRGSSS